MLRLGLGIGCLLAACYSPHPAAGAACAPGNTCPEPLECVSSPTGPVCEPHGTVFADASVAHDAPLADGNVDGPVTSDAPADAQLPQPMLVQKANNFVTIGATLQATFPNAPAAGDLVVMIGAANGGALDTVTGGGATTWMKATGSSGNQWDAAAAAFAAAN